MEDEKAAAPLVSVIVTAYNRPGDLRVTLRRLREQTYRPLELLVVDDASPTDLGPVVREEWPDARFWRNERNRGLIANRSMLMREARGDFVLSLDDDSNLTRPDDLERAVRRFAGEPRLGAITFAVHEGTEPPAQPGDGPERYVHSYVGCAHLLRAEMIRELGGYRDFFHYYAEESEYCLRAIGRGWRVLLLPHVVVHHRLSPVGRSQGRIWAHGFRNNLWTAAMHMPFPRVLGEVGWKLAVNSVEMVRIAEPRWWLWALGSFARGLPAALRHRQPLSREALRAYDATRFRDVRTAEELRNAPGLSPAEGWRWLRGTWWHRRRGRAFWDSREGGLGKSLWNAPQQKP